jgi:3-oxoacyl-[acyl-carrier-protein] synthase-3
LSNKLNSFGVKITNTSSYLPEGEMSNQDIIDEYSLRLKDEWVKLNIGIEKRHWCKNGEKASDLGANALKQVLDGKDDLDALIVSTISQDVMTPATACIIQSLVTPGKLYPAFDLTAACGGFVFAIDQGRRMIQTGMNKVACVATETRSYYLNKKDRRTVMLFGDGAGAVTLAPCEEGETGIFYSKTISDGRYWNSIVVPGAGSEAMAETGEAKCHIEMRDAQGIFESAIKEMSNLITDALTQTGLSKEDIGTFIFHQASRNIVNAAAKNLEISEDQYIVNFDQVGNMTSASVAVLLDQAVKDSKIKKGDNVCIIATGGGFSAGVILLRWEY